MQTGHVSPAFWVFGLWFELEQVREFIQRPGEFTLIGQVGLESVCKFVQNIHI